AHLPDSSRLDRGDQGCPALGRSSRASAELCRILQQTGGGSSQHRLGGSGSPAYDPSGFQQRVGSRRRGKNPPETGPGLSGSQVVDPSESSSEGGMAYPGSV